MRRVRLIVAAVAAAVVLAAVGYYVYVRHISMNFGVVVEGKVYRSAQPAARTPTKRRRPGGSGSA